MKISKTTKALLGTAVSFALLGTANVASAADLDNLSDDDLLARIERLEKIIGPGDKYAVRSGTKKIRVTLNGQINQKARYSTNGTDSAVQIVDNDASSSRFRILGEGKIADDFKIKTVFEFDLEVNPSDEIDQDDNFNFSSQVSSAANFEIRKAEIIFDHKKYGRFFLGQGDPFSNKVIEQDLSGATLAVGDFSFDDDGLDFLALGENVGDIHDAQDGISRTQRVRYDTPSFAGFRIGASYIQDRTYDVGVEYKTKDLAGFAIKARAAYFAFLDSAAVNPAVNAQSRAFAGSASVLHNASGISLTGFYNNFFDDASAAPGETDFSAWGVKAGYQTKNITSAGKTAFAVDFSRYNGTPEAEDFATAATNSINGYSIGVQATQKIDKASTELFAGYRMYSVDSAFTDTGVFVPGRIDETIHVVSAGARVKF